MKDGPYPLDPLEIASGVVLGADEPALLSGTRGDLSPREALERVVLQGLEHPPCLVSFSGGRDSSAVLAVAAHVARREALPLPIPATNRFPATEQAAEEPWQELVVSHLGLEDWLRLEQDDELDCVGPVAGEVLQRHGLLWPFNAHFHVPLLRAAAGGSLLTGVGGDEALGAGESARIDAVLTGRARPEPRDALRLALAAAPSAVRRRVRRQRLAISFPWLRPVSERQVLEEWAAEQAAAPVRWAARVRWVRRLRYLRVGERSLAVLARGAGARILHPFLHVDVVEALARLPRNSRYRTRTAAMQDLFADLLPAGTLERASKASFDAAFFNRHSRDLVEAWSGEGVATDHVDPSALRATWRSDRPDPRSFLLLQAVWIARAGTRAA